MSGPYPELERQAAVIEEANKIGEFLDWLSDQGIMLAQWTDVGGFRDEILVTIPTGSQQLLERFYDIDPQKIEAERRALLDSIRKLEG